jgi:DNA-3-methyladenine glycosylase I
MPDNKIRCPWSLGSPEMIKYHDTEWGVPVKDEVKLFEFLMLDAFQAGLSWVTVLKKRENFREAFDNFNPAQVATYNQKKIDKLLQNTGIIRNKLKINAVIINAQKVLEFGEGKFAEYIWSFTGGKPYVNAWKNISQIPAKTKLSERMSKDLIKHGFKFVGSTICYAFMQAAGIVNDHLTSCFRYSEIINKYKTKKISK